VRRRDGEEGVAIITVMLVMVVLTLLVSGTLAYSIAAQPQSRRDQDSAAALAAAQAGIDDYMYRLRTAEFERYSSSNLPASPDDVPFRPTAWQAMPGSANGAQFHYDVKVTNGVITLTSTGRVRNVERTVQALIRRRSFLDYLYFTDNEVLDPASGFYRANRAEAAAACDQHWWEGRDATKCTAISFGGGDAINGPLHTNDTIRVSGSVSFNAAASTSMPATSCTPARRWWSSSSSVCATPIPGPVFSRPGDPAYALPVTMPATSGDLPSIAAASGCLYNGPTRITLKATGLMDVVSDFTTDAGIRSRCVGTGRELPGVIHVQNVPSGQTSPACPSSGNRLDYPIAGDITRYECRTGDAFVSGVLNGRLTISAENDVIVVDDLTYNSLTSPASTPTDMLGLIAEQFVEVYHPVSCSSPYDDGSVRTCDSGTGTNLADPRVTGGGPLRNPDIHAAILSLNHSFIVQNYRNGASLGDLTVYGAISQKWRGPVALLGSTGYVKVYNYDARLAYEGPPSFIDPVTQPWKVKAFAEVANPPRCTTTVVTACMPP
jgi:hypothetical protein